jgi:Flp pilus assembly protein TadG
VVEQTVEERGAALVELAIALPLLMLILVGTVDFARVFYMSIELTNAARAGAQFGAASLANSGRPADMQAAAVGAAPDIGHIDVTAARVCWCATNAAAFTAVACNATCGAGEHLVASATVTASRTFTTIASLPGIPNAIVLTRTATMRVR